MRLVPLMGVLGAFIFACQMLNFTIPGTGSSGHLGGGLILAVLLGPYAGFLVMAAILFKRAKGVPPSKYMTSQADADVQPAPDET